jgi:hypothetical protein
MFAPSTKKTEEAEGKNCLMRASEFVLLTKCYWNVKLK